MFKKYYFQKIIWTCHLLCERPRCYHSTSKTQVAERIFKLRPIYASVIYQIAWIHWIFNPFWENSNIIPIIKEPQSQILGAWFLKQSIEFREKDFLFQATRMMSTILSLLVSVLSGGFSVWLLNPRMSFVGGIVMFY